MDRLTSWVLVVTVLLLLVTVGHRCGQALGLWGTPVRTVVISCEWRPNGVEHCSTQPIRVSGR